MGCEIAFLAVGNADSIIISPDADTSVLIDIPDPRVVTDWLYSRGTQKIECIYITHAHRDHFVPLIGFIDFMAQWFDAGGSVERVIVGLKVFDDVFDELRALESAKADGRKIERLRHTVERLNVWRKSIQFSDEARNKTPSYTKGELAIQVLHPETVFASSHRTKYPKRLNELSLVLRITFGKFAAILLADLEGEGISECLQICKDEELKAQVVKVAHHGAWPSPVAADYEKLLRKIDAELAILSVGSNNKYGHVVPELFQQLIELVNESLPRMNKFMCTEITRTCTKSSAERAAMGDKGLSGHSHCAGNIVLRCDVSGEYKIKTETDHEAVINGLKYPACRQRADI